jgi:hypothetical protein
LSEGKCKLFLFPYNTSDMLFIAKRRKRRNIHTKKNEILTRKSEISISTFRVLISLIRVIISTFRFFDFFSGLLINISTFRFFALINIQEVTQSISNLYDNTVLCRTIKIDSLFSSAQKLG